MNDLDKIPEEVWRVWAIEQAGHPVGAKTYAEIQKIIDKYPEYFPWEHKYKSIPQEVHDAFTRECYPERFKPYEWTEFKGMSLIEQIQQELTAIVPLTKESFTKIFTDMIEQDNRKRKEKFEEEIRVKKIWNKHYSKYKLEYRP